MGNDCLYRYKYAAAWVAPFIDIDEFVGPMPPSILPKELMRDDSVSPEIKAGAQVGWRSCRSGTPAQSFQLTKYGKLRIGNNLCVGIRDGSLELHKCTYEDDADSEIWTKRIISGQAGSTQTYTDAYMYTHAYLSPTPSSQKRLERIVAGLQCTQRMLVVRS